MNSGKPEFRTGPGARILDVIERIDSDPSGKAVDELYEVMDESPENERRAIDTTRLLHAASVTLASEHSIDEWVAIAKEGFAAQALGLGVNEAAQTAPADTLGRLAGRPTLVAARAPWYSRPATQIAMAAVVAGVSVLAWYFLQANESKVIALPDASSMRRYAHSRINVSYSEKERRVDVEKGGGAFEVKHDEQRRPFNVYSGEIVITAQGTQFNVFRRSGVTDVYLAEGSLDVSREDTVLFQIKQGDLVHIRDNGQLAKPAPHELPVGDMTYVQIAEAFNRENPVLRFEVLGAARTLRVPAGNVAELTEPVAWIEAIQADPALHVTSKLGVVTIEAASSN